MSLEERVLAAEALNRAFFAQMRRKVQCIDLITLCDELRSQGTLELVGGLAKLARMVTGEDISCL